MVALFWEPWYEAKRLPRLGRLGRLTYDFIKRYYRLPLRIGPSFSHR